MMPMRPQIICLLILSLTSIVPVNSTSPKRTHEQAFGLQPSSSSSRVPQPHHNDPHNVSQHDSSSHLPPSKTNLLGAKY
jgi:hypothetical protein